MIHVIASVKIISGKRGEFLEIFKSNMSSVREEAGCVEYFPTIDIDAALPPQVMDADVVTIIEKWESPEALRNHLATPHMLAYKEKTKEMVEGVTIKVLQEA
jgi:quinol monooxygenase YgiN